MIQMARALALVRARAFDELIRYVENPALSEAWGQLLGAVALQRKQRMLLEVLRGIGPEIIRFDDVDAKTRQGISVVEYKPFDRKKEHGDETAYGKVKFAEEVVKPNVSTIDFSDFTELLSRMDQCLTHYATVVAASPAAAAAAS